MTAGATEVYNFIVHKIRSGEWMPHDKIWVESEFVRRLQIPKSSVRQAIDLLQTKGLLKKVQGSGTYVQPLSLASTLSVAALPFTPIMTDADLIEWLRFRKYFEYGNILLFASNINDQHLAALEDTFTRMQNNTHNFRVYAEADAEFHTIIALGTGNHIIARINEAFQNAYISFLQYQAEFYGTDNGLEHHRSIINWLKEGDGALAAQIMLKHIEAAEATARVLQAEKAEALSFRWPGGRQS